MDVLSSLLNFHVGRGGRRKSQVGIKDSPMPSIWYQRELFCCLLIVHGARQHNLALPGHPYLKLLGKHSQKEDPTPWYRC